MRIPITVFSYVALSLPLLLTGCKSDQRKDPAPATTTNPATTAAEGTNKAGADSAAAAEAEALEHKLAEFAPVTITADVTALPASEQQALTALIEAARLLDPVFERQVYSGNPALSTKLSADDSRLGKARYGYFQLMRGPWDRQDALADFAQAGPRPPGGGYYPDDLTEEAFRAYLDAHPDQREALTSPYTVVRHDGDALVAVPYSEAYAEWLEPAAAKLEAAAEHTENASLATFLRARAAAFRSNDYYQSDKDWMDLDSQVEITIGPYETYEDHLMGLKAAYEAFVTVADPEASEALSKFKALLPAMEQNLPVADEVKTKRGAESPIRVVDLVFASGDARTSVQTIAFNLPNDERVRSEKGAKKVLLRNVIKTKFDAIMAPIGSRVISPEQRPLLSAEGFFQETLFHELSHSLGPAFVLGDPKNGEVKSALGASYAALEEGKADAMGAYNILYMIDEGHFPAEFRDPLLVTYFAGLLRSVRFGVTEAHGKGAALQINRYLAAKAVTFDDGSATFTVDLEAFPAALEALVRDMCMWQHNGDKAVVESQLAEHGVMSPPIAAALAKLDGIPVDIRPRYPVAGE